MGRVAIKTKRILSLEGDARNELIAAAIRYGERLTIFEHDHPAFVKFRSVLIPSENRPPVIHDAVPDAIQPLPRSEWPHHIELIAKFRSDSDVGVGDTIERSAGGVGRVFKDWFKKVTGKPCGCSARKEMFNTRYPYT